MSLPYGTQPEIDARNACYKAFSPVVINITDEPDLGSGLTTRLTFTADQNYVIVGAYISGLLTDFSINPPTRAILAWTFNTGSVTFGTAGNNNGNIIASIVIGGVFSSVATSKSTGYPSTQAWDFSKYPFYLSKGAKIFMAMFLDAATPLAYTASLYLIPTFA